MTHNRSLRLGALLFGVGIWVGSVASATSPTMLTFQSRLLALDANEGMAAGDVDGDGVTDLVAGRFWFRGGDWAARPIRNIDDWNGYVKSNGDYLFDVDDDGRLDVIAGDFMSTQIMWFRNPGEEGLRLGKLWQPNLLVDTGASKNEGQLMHDLDGDGRPEWIVNSWAKDVPMMVWRMEPKVSKDAPQESRPAGKNASSAAYRMKPHMLGETGNGHGVGVGDISGDGKLDVLVGQGWYEQPASKPWQQPWTFHADWDLHASLPMLVTDLDADGDQDLIFGNGHDYGLYWWEQTGRDDDGKITWNEHLIDRGYSQPHSMVWADLNGDGQPDLVTGKRVLAHNGKDPGGTQPPCVYWYDWHSETKQFQRHLVDEGTVGTGLQIVVDDLNEDGVNDIAVAGKSGTYLLLADPSNSDGDS